MFVVITDAIFGYRLWCGSGDFMWTACAPTAMTNLVQVTATPLAAVPAAGMLALTHGSAVALMVTVLPGVPRLVSP